MRITDVEFVRDLLVEICLVTSQILYEQCENTMGSEKGIVEYGNEIENLRNINEAHEYIKQHIGSVRKKSHLVEFKDCSAPVQTVIDYINENYWRDVSLQEAVDRVSLSSGYLCSLIKKKTGENFIALVNKLIINKAEQLPQGDQSEGF